MTGLPVVMPSAGISSTIRIGRDYHVRIGSSDYSVDPVVIGRIVTLNATLDRVTATCDGHLVADHPRCHKPHQTITEPAHVARAAQLRHDYQARQTTSRDPITLVEQRDLSVYDQLWNLEVAA